ncbi:tRNA (cytidine(32)-2'-O)-methyltransferase non-catalytic subunit TRM732 [Escovopsis weberi]|uniref:tRNA (Cytidine(32)-2'-O)-methyltransferase non-catalytic subunit TRM732 n=1 Tax=Escovopsis weberi TaxID=150374 RepID=A0A0M8N1F7_ESCWE|nr:tRNA (cytidine(32)-2'-O)-methyltransferase non-catalytic subunit TRM732 [Escovopsis weberi]
MHVEGVPEHPKSVSGQGCVKLCGFVEQAAKAQTGELLRWSFSRDVVFELFTFYIEWNEFDHHRSMRLVLDLVAQLLGRNPDKGAVAAIRDALLDNLVSIVIGRSTKPVAKSAFKTLDYLLVKGVFTLRDVHSAHAAHLRDGVPGERIEIWGLFMADLFQWIKLHFVCPAAGKFIVSVYRDLRQGGHDDASGVSIETWHRWLLAFLVEDPSLLERIKNYIFLPLFKADRSEAVAFLQKMNENSPISVPAADFDTPALLRLAALETGKKVGLVEEPYLTGGQHAEDPSCIVLQEAVLEGVLAHPSHEVRSLAFTLLISSPSTTRPYSSTTLDLLKRHLATFFSDPDAKFRVDVCARARDMFKRVRGAIAVLKRSIPRARAKAQKGIRPSSEAAQPILYHTNLISLPEAQLVDCLQYHERFLKWYAGFLCAELTPTASYQRHITSLKSLMFILRMEGEAVKNWETPEDQELLYDLFDDKWMRALADLVMDPFDDVRELSSLVLARFLADKKYRRFGFDGQRTDQSPAEELGTLLQRANDLSRRTSRADHSDGVARASQLLYKFLETGEERLALLSRLVDSLEDKTLRAETDLGRAVLEFPLHSDFAALCFTWQVVSEKSFSPSELDSVNVLQERLGACCVRIWKAVRDILCDDSPEGHLPQELEDMEGLDTKGLLSYSFRSIHESSNLMRTLALAMRNKSKPGMVTPSRSLFEEIGNLTFDQLASLRHRGAFTTVAATFATCCQLTRHLEPIEGEEPILKVWYRGAMNAIFTQASTTRRSAGIPSLVTGILSANAAEPSFEEVIEKLMEIASIEARTSETDGSKLPQVHAYNCLKDIFKNSLLSSMGNKSESYLPQCLELAASGLRSEVWAIRNCGLIFLRSLIDTLFGSQESKSMIEAGWDGKANRIPYHRYPNLPLVLANLLKSGHLMAASTAATSAAESVFPALDIIRRAGPPDLLRDEIQVHVAAYLSSPVWHVREIAARTLCSCLLHERWLAVIKKLLGEAISDESPNGKNYMHGVLLSLKFVFERFRDVSLVRLTTDLPELTTLLAETQIGLQYSSCPDVVAAYLEVINMIWMFQIFISQPLQPPQTSIPPINGSALFKSQSLLNCVISASQEDRAVDKVRALLLENHIGADTLVTILQAIPTLWPPSSTQSGTLLDLSMLYIDLCFKTPFMEPQAEAINNLAEVLDRLLESDSVTERLSSSLVDLWSLLPLRPLNPSLSNAIIRMSGGTWAACMRARDVPRQTLRGWGLMMSDAGLDDKSFDERLAAAESLRSFFSAAGDACNSEDCLPAILALYDTLNDDDDEVREVGSDAARSILGRLLVPMEAANRLLQWLASRFATSAALKAAVARRIVGACGVHARTPPRPAEDQLAAALEVDDSLFAVEEQNLFVDEVREAARWAGVFEALAWEGAGDAQRLCELEAWVRGGLARLRTLLEQRGDGPLGWASSPRAFAIGSRIIRGAVALSRAHGSLELRGEVAELRGLCSGARARQVSKLLTEPVTEVMG